MKPPRRTTRWLALVLVECMLLPVAALANPAGGVVRGGTATITGQGTPVVDIHQRSQGAVLSWKSFDIQPGEVTNFHQPNAGAVAVNRILEGQASRILGGLNANGHVYLINPNGILFGPNAVVNVGALTAATSVKAGDLIALGHGFDPSAVSRSGAKIENQGRIQTGEGGFVYLVAPQVENGKSGVIVSPKGQVELAAGATVYLTDRPDGLGVAIQYTAPGKPGGAAVNLGKLVADGGLVRLRADLVRQAGVVEANAVRRQGGKIELVADSKLSLASGSTTAATGGAGVGPGGSVVAKSGGDATVSSGAAIDVSGGAQGGAGGSLELSGKGAVSLSGTVRADGHAGAAGGKVVIDPSELLVTGQQTFSGASSVSLTASRTVSIENNASIDLTNPVGTPTLDVRSGGDVVFGSNARITEGAGSGATNHWNVQLLAGAQDLTDPTSLALDPASNGGIFLSGAKQLATGQVDRNTSGEATPLRNNGLVSLVYGDLLAYASGDVWIGNGGGIVNQRGAIDVQAGRNVRFTASSTSQDGVIQNGSGDIHVVAGGSVILTGIQNGADASAPGTSFVQGNAAIRTVGISSVDAQGHPIQDDGGSIFVQATNGDVDSGVGNRWLQPGPVSQDFFGNTPTDPTLDKMPVVSQGILGIGSQVGGDVTVIAGGDVYTGRSSQARTGGSAYQTSGAADYTGSHIGLFGRPVDTTDPRSDSSGPRVLPNPPASRLLVIAGGDIAGDYMVRQGRGVFRAGYSLAPGADATALSADDLPGLAANLQRSALTTDPTRGWFGSLASPVTVDLMEGRAILDPADPTHILQSSIDALGANGVAVRAIENPSLVYPPDADTGVFRVPSYAPSDSARLEAETGDVVLVGNGSDLPALDSSGQTPRTQNDLVWLLPPSLSVVTHPFQRGLESRGGDLVILNPFTLFPSSSGGLSLDVAGMVRSPGRAALGIPSFDLTLAQTTGAAADRSVTIPAGTELVDPLTGLRFKLNGSLSWAPRLPAIPAATELVFRLTPGAASQSLTVPAGTRISDGQGHIFQVASDTIIPGPAGRYSQGSVTFVSDRSTESPITIPQSTQLVAPDGTIFLTTRAVQLSPGQTGIAVGVRAGSPGHDAPAYGLKLLNPIAGIASATNDLPTVRLPQGQVSVSALVAGNDGLIPEGRLTSLIDPVPGVLSVFNPSQAQGQDASLTGQPTSVPQVSAELSGPAAEVASGHTLVLADPSALPPGVNPSDIQIRLGGVVGGGAKVLQPVVFRQLQVIHDPATGQILSTRVDPPADEIVLASGSDVWTQPSILQAKAGIAQSDATPGFDARTAYFLPFDYGRYYRECRSGSACAVPWKGTPLGRLGTLPTHAADSTPALLRAVGGFQRISLGLAESVDLETDGSLLDLRLSAQNNSAKDVTLIDVPYGNVSFGAAKRPYRDAQTGVSVPVADDVGSGIVVSGPGKAQLLVGVVPFDQALKTQDTNGDGAIEPSEFQGSKAVFDSLDQGPLPDGKLTRTEAPYLPTGSGGVLSLPNLQSAGSQGAGGITTIGNNLNSALPPQGASLDIRAAGDVLLGSRGSIGSVEGGDVSVQSIGGAVLGGVPAQATTEQRGIFSLYAAPTGSLNDRPAEPTGGGAISVDAFGDIDVGGLAIATLSGSDITLGSRGGSVKAGVSAPFSNALVHYDATQGTLTAQFSGGGIHASGEVHIKAKKSVDTGNAGISGAGITIDAGQNVTGTGAIQSSAGVSIAAGGSITGNISAVGSVTVSKGTVSQGASVSSSGGLVSGAGSVASNTGGSRTSADTNNLGGRQVAEAMAGAGFGGGRGVGGPRKGVRIEVSSTPVSSSLSSPPPVSAPPCKDPKGCR